MSATFETPSRTPSLSLCMIIKDEAFFLADCLASVRDHVDQIVVLDTGSTDGSAQIARQYADVVEDFDWVDDFSAARNASIELATGDWILVLDADERISEQDFGLIQRTIADTDLDGFYCIQRNYDNDPNQPEWYPVNQPSALTRDYKGFQANPILRLFRNRPDIRFSGRVHELLDPAIPEDSRDILPVALHHYMDEDPTKPRVKRQLRYLNLLEACIEESPTGLHYRKAAAVRMYFLKDYARAAQYYRKAAELGESPQRSLEGAAEAHYRAGDPDAAQQLYGELYDGGFASVTLCNNYANLLVKKSDYSRAIAVLKTALQGDIQSTERRARIQGNIAALEAMAAKSQQGE